MEGITDFVLVVTALIVTTLMILIVGLTTIKNKK